MIRFLPLFCLGCASLPEVRPCEPQGAVIQPEFVRIGDNDLMLASMRYNGCEPFQFRLCGIGDDWLREDGATLGIWHDQSLSSCPDLILEDETLNLGPLRTRYEDEFDVDQADLLLIIGDLEIDYSFAPLEE